MPNTLSSPMHQRRRFCSRCCRSMRWKACRKKGVLAARYLHARGLLRSASRGQAAKSLGHKLRL